MDDLVEKKSIVGAQPPGDSLPAQRRRIIDAIVPPYFFFAGMFVALAAFEWYRSIFATHESPWGITAAALIAIGVSAYKIARALPEFRDER